MQASAGARQEWQTFAFYNNFFQLFHHGATFFLSTSKLPTVKMSTFKAVIKI
jgi:hypothetical protein